jgi:SET domain-containing protein
MLNKCISYNSKIEGTGLRSISNIKQGEIVALFEGFLINVDIANSWYLSGNDHMLQISNDNFLAITGDEKYVNHSCSPNCAFLNNNGELIALRDIDKNEEITFDYSANENTEFQFDCGCNTLKCRKQVKGFFQLTDAEKISLSTILSPYIRNLKKHT